MRLTFGVQFFYKFPYYITRIPRLTDKDFAYVYSTVSGDNLDEEKTIAESKCCSSGFGSNLHAGKIIYSYIIHQSADSDNISVYRSTVEASMAAMPDSTDFSNHYMFIHIYLNNEKNGRFIVRPLHLRL